MSADIVIIGAGIVGLSSAYELSRRGAKVLVLDRGEAGREASWAGGGILFPLLPWDYREEVNALASAGAALYPEFSAALFEASGVDPEYLKCGMTILPGERDMRGAASWCEAHDVPFSESGGSFRLPEVAQLRNPRLIRALRKTLEGMGVTLLENREVVSIRRQGEGIAAIETTGGESHSAAGYVVCAGAWSRDLLEPALPGPEIFPVKGQMLLFDAPGLLDTLLLRDEIYLVPRLDGHLLVGSTLEYSGFDKSVSTELGRSLHEKACAMLPGLDRLSPVRQWAGLRPGSPLNVPTICRHPDASNLYLNCGHFRYGVTMAPASAKLLASLVLDHAEAPRAYSCKK